MNGKQRSKRGSLKFAVVTIVLVFVTAMFSSATVKSMTKPELYAFHSSQESGEVWGRGACPFDRGNFRIGIFREGHLLQAAFERCGGGYPGIKSDDF